MPIVVDGKGTPTTRRGSPIPGVPNQRDRATNGGIRFFQTIKIRSIFEKIYKVSGYPVRWAHYVGYYSGLGLWVHDDFIINAHQTTFLWENEPDKKWREVVIGRIPDIITREIPLVAHIASIISKQVYTERWQVFENLAFYNTMNDIVIKHNWDKIRVFLNGKGY